MLREAQRTLHPWQRETVLANFERCGLPLYLKLAAEESRLWKSYTPENACKLGEGVAGVVDTLFDRLANNANHGPVLVERSLSYLAAARYGLSEDEVLDVLTADDAVWSDFDQRKHHEVTGRRLPVVVWSRLSLDLEPYLTERAAPGGTVTAFYHRQLAERVTGRFLAGAELQARHDDLARHFSAKPAWLDEGWKVPNARRAVEFVFQQRGAQRWTEAQATLFDSQFLFAKCAAGLVLDLDADYQALLQEAPESEVRRREVLRQIHGALRLSMHVVAQEPAQFASQMVGRLLAHRDMPGVGKFVDEIIAEAPRPLHSVLLPITCGLTSPGGTELLTLSGHTESVTSVVVYSDSTRAVSASRDQTLKVWDLQKGIELFTLRGHTAAVNSVVVYSNGKRAISASDDRSLRIWNLDTGLELQTLLSHEDKVNAVAVYADGKRAVSASDDRTLRIWELGLGTVLHVMDKHLFGVNAVTAYRDGLLAISGSDDRWLKIWDLEQGRELRTLRGHAKEVSSVVVDPSGNRAVSGSHGGTLKLWDLNNGRSCPL